MDKEKALTIWLPVIADGVKDLPECKESLEMAIEALENQKTGHWETICPITSWQFTRDHYKCSECGTHWEYTFNYCPNCGAKMKGE